MKNKQVPSCIYCKYFKPMHYPYKNNSIGECHRYPKESYVYTVAHWCGEFKKGAKK